MEPKRPPSTVKVLPTAFSFAGWIKQHRRRLIISFVLLMHTLGFVTSIRAILETRSSQGAIAWAISLNTVPCVAVPAYWVFGQSKFDDYDVVRNKDILASSDTGRETARILEEQGMLVTLEMESQHPRATPWRCVYPQGQPMTSRPSRQVRAADYTEASLWFRLTVRVARLLAPVQ